MAVTPKQPRNNPLCRFRAAKGWTQHEAAERLGVSWSTYKRLEACQQLPKRYQHALEGLKAKYVVA